MRKDIVHKQKQKKTTGHNSDYSVDGGRTFISQVKLRAQRRILFGPGLSVWELD